MKRLLGLLVLVFLVGCSEADIASNNLSREADQFRVDRRIVFYNGITNQYLLEIRGRCSLGNFDSEGQLSVTCKTGTGFKKHFLGLSDNVTYFAEQLESAEVGTYRYQVIFNPRVIVPDVELR